MTEEPIKLDYDVIGDYKSNEYSSSWCLENMMARWPGAKLEDVPEELHAEIIKLARLELYDHDQHQFIVQQYGVKLDAADTVLGYISLVVDTLLPITDPRRIALEVEFKERLVRGTLHAKRQIEEREGKAKLITPQNGLVVPPNGKGH
jgi:hypothetical protein